MAFAENLRLLEDYRSSRCQSVYDGPTAPPRISIAMNGPFQLINTKEFMIRRRSFLSLPAKLMVKNIVACVNFS